MLGKTLTYIFMGSLANVVGMFREYLKSIYIQYLSSPIYALKSAEYCLLGMDHVFRSYQRHSKPLHVKMHENCQKSTTFSVHLGSEVKAPGIVINFQ